MINNKFFNIIILFYLFIVIIFSFINFNSIIKKKHVLDGGGHALV